MVDGDILPPPLEKGNDAHENINEKRNAIRSRQKIWRTRVIPYTFHSSLCKYSKPDIEIFNDLNLCSQDYKWLSFLKLGTGVEEYLEGYQTSLLRFIGVSNIAAKLQNV